MKSSPRKQLGVVLDFSRSRPASKRQMGRRCAGRKKGAHSWPVNFSSDHQPPLQTGLASGVVSGQETAYSSRSFCFVLDASLIAPLLCIDPTGPKSAATLPFRPSPTSTRAKHPRHRLAESK